MAYSLLFGERPLVPAATSPRPLRNALFAWLAKVRERRAQRAALYGLLELDQAMLDDLGIDRHDVLEVLHRPHRAGTRLAYRRARKADDWLSHP